MESSGVFLNFVHTFDFDECDLKKKKNIKMISHLILTFNKCEKYVCIYWSKTEKNYSDLIYDSKELNFFFSEIM